MKCPLCHTEMKDEVKSGNFDSNYKFIQTCPTTVKFEGKLAAPHCEILTMYSGAVEEHWYLPPYHIVYTGTKTVVGEVDPGYITSYTRKPLFKFIFETTQRLHPASPEKIIERIRLLTTFS